MLISLDGYFERPGKAIECLQNKTGTHTLAEYLNRSNYG